MRHLGTNNHPLRIAIIGAGPAGFYTAGQLLKQAEISIEIDLFDRLPTPYGLVRGGVAPDHQKIKSVTKIYERIAKREQVRFFGYVEFGTDITLDDLKAHYHQIVFATGAQTGKRLDIPGTDLIGSYPASDFVAWYNGHPDYRDLKFDLSKESAAVIGMGNVALDVARILCRTPDELYETDIADYALEALRESNIKDVYLLGRRGPAQAAFTPPEIKEIGQLSNVDIFIRPEEAALDKFSQTELNEKQDKAAIKNVETIQEFAGLNTEGKSRRLHFRFLVSPIALIGCKGDHVRKVRLVKNKLTQTEVGTLRPQPTNQYEEISAGLVFHSIGYRGVALPGVPFDERRGIIPHQKGRVINSEKETPISGLYTVGWIKRGPSGVIGTNKLDAIETVDVMLGDIKDGKILYPAYPDADSAKRMVCQLKPDFVYFKDWLHLDQIEIDRGQAQNRTRLKFTVIEEMLSNLERSEEKIPT